MQNQNSLRVLQLTTGLGVGGAERVVMELSSELISLGIDTHIFSISRDITIINQYPSLKNLITSLAIDKTPRQIITAALKLNRYIKEHSINVVHAHMFHALILSVFAKILNWRIKIVFTSHSFSGFSKARWAAIFFTKIFRACDIIFSQRQHPRLNVKVSKIIPNSIKVLSNPIRNSYLDNNTYRFIFVGRLEHPKNPQLLIKQFSQIKFQNCELHIVGDGYLRSELERLVAGLGIQDRVIFHGKSDNVKDHLNETDCFVLTSRYEGLPMVILEAGAVGMPVISTPVGAIPELLSEKCGYLTKEEDICSTMEQVIYNRFEARATGERLLKKIAAHYSLEAMTHEHINIYKKCLGMK